MVAMGSSLLFISSADCFFPTFLQYHQEPVSLFCILGESLFYTNIIFLCQLHMYYYHYVTVHVILYYILYMYIYIQTVYYVTEIHTQQETFEDTPKIQKDL